MSNRDIANQRIDALVDVIDVLKNRELPKRAIEQDTSFNSNNCIVRIHENVEELTIKISHFKHIDDVTNKENIEKAKLIAGAVWGNHTNKFNADDDAVKIFVDAILGSRT
jgi:hypothetical protein